MQPLAEGEMPYFPKDTERAYRCPNCGGWFIPGNISCCVAHAPGTCCHEYETPTIARPSKVGAEGRALPPEAR